MDCPICGESTRTMQGLRQHHTKVHGKPLPNRVCKGCGDEFYDPKSQRKFCDHCNPNGGKHNGNWKGGKEATTCRKCGADFKFYPSDKDGIYCPQCVAGSDEFLGDPYRKEAERFAKGCKNCGDEMIVLQTDWDRGEGRVCSFDCLCEWMSEDGTIGKTSYGKGWEPLKRRTLRRDQHRCQNCGKSSAKLGREPDVHHIEPVRNFDEMTDALHSIM